jgi:GTP cyclohydrolase II
VPPNKYTRFYLETKAVRSGHQIDFHGKPHLPEQDEPVIVEESERAELGADPSRKS